VFLIAAFGGLGQYLDELAYLITNKVSTSNPKKQAEVFSFIEKCRGSLGNLEIVAQKNLRIALSGIHPLTLLSHISRKSGFPLMVYIVNDSSKI
jgi:predicted amidohydrolase